MKFDEIRFSLNSRGAPEDSVAAARLAELDNLTTASTRGYVLTPLRAGFADHSEFLRIRISEIS